jgi:hypothetical protein
MSGRNFQLNIVNAQTGQQVQVMRHVLEKFGGLRICGQLRQLAAFLGTLSVLGNDAHWARLIESRMEPSQSACQSRQKYGSAVLDALVSPLRLT